MQPRLIQIAETVIGKSRRDHPADVTLREELRRATGLSRADSREISRAVFAYYRWFGWLDQPLQVMEGLRQTMELDLRYREQPHSFSIEELLARAVPAWVNDFMEVSSAWVQSLQREPPLWLRARRDRGKTLAEQLGECWVGEGRLQDAVRYEGREDLFRSPEFHAGEFELQDINSQVVGLLCDPQPGETWWDACAGEGGKLLHISDLMGNKGLIWASDRAEWRLKKLKQRTARAKVFNYRSALWVGGEKLPTKTKFDGVLVDAPCSGIGTWQRNPQARWTLTQADVLELRELQQQLLANAVTAVKAGGRLVFSVCTPSRTETSEVVSAFEKRFTEFKPLPLGSPFPKGASAAQHLFWPQETDGNGMFVAAWKKS